MAVDCRVLESGVCSITQPFHYAGQKGYDYEHLGIDITGFNGSYNVLDWVVAHSDGTIMEMRNNCVGFEDHSYGNYVLIKHPNGVYTLYAHLSYGTVQVSVGQQVKKGQRLGYMGNTGTSFGGHLHWEVRDYSGYKLDPEPWLNKEFPNMPKTGWVKENGYWYLYDKNGNLLKGWQKVGNNWYFLDKNSGYMHTGWVYDPDYAGWFLLALDGHMLTGWQKDKGKWYYLRTKTSTTDPKKCKGRMYHGWLKDKGRRYYLQVKATSKYKEGEMRKGWLSYKGDKYYLSPETTDKFKEGQAVTGTVTIDGKTYKFDKNGKLIK